MSAGDAVLNEDLIVGGAPNDRMAATSTAPDGACPQAAPERPVGYPRHRARHTPPVLQRHRTAIIVTTVAVVLAGALAVTDLRARAELRRTDAHLTSTTEQLRATEVKVADARTDLRRFVGQDRDLDASLWSTGMTLAAAQRSLTAAQQHRLLLTVDAQALQTCLSGVEQAIDGLSVGDTNSGLAALNAVSQNCRRATASSGDQ
jgi:hypothetical protein